MSTIDRAPLDESTIRTTLVAARVLADMTQTALADRIGCTRGNVSMYESGKSSGSVWFLANYARVVGYKIAVLQLM